MAKADLIQVRQVFRKKMATLIEYLEEGVPVRVSVPSSCLITSKDGTLLISKENLDRGLPYGIPWKYKLKISEVTPESLELELHKAGIWTAEDVMKNPQAVKSALMSALRISMSDIQTIAKQNLYKEK